MAEKVIMPKAGQTMEEGTVVRWLKKEGDPVKKGEALLVVSTDKADLEVESFHDGVLLKIIVGEGQTAAVLEPIAVVGRPGESIDIGAATAAAAASTAAAAATPAAAPAAQAAAAGAPSTAPPGRVIASPLAKRIAKESGVDLSSVPGTGPGGRIVRRDVEAAKGRVPAVAPSAVTPAAAPAPKAPAAPAVPTAPAAPPPPFALAGKTIELQGMRKAIAGALQMSKREAPHFYATMEIDMTAAMTFREYLKSTGVAATVNDLVVRAVILALARVREVSCRVEGNKVTYPEDINVGVAVGLDQGLVVPVVMVAQNRDLADLARETKRIVDAARGGKLIGMGQGTFTVSNLGMFGIDHFQAIINPPEGAILAVGAVKERLVARDGGIFVRKMMNVTLSVDHRAIDGLAASRFLNELRGFLEKPERLTA